MRLSVYALAAVATLAVTLPAAAQDFRVRTGDDGVNVRVGRDHDHDRDRGREHRHWREGRGDCRMVVTRFRNEDGDLIIRRVRRCG